MNDLNKALYVIGRVRDDYTFLQASIFFELLAKTVLKAVPDQIEKNDPSYTVDFDTGFQYRLRNDYIVRALKISKEHGGGFALIAETGLIQGFTSIVTKTYELLDTRNDGSRVFRDYCERKLGTHFESFVTIVQLFRHVFTHSISEDYKLKEKDFKAWKNKLIEKGVTEIRLKGTITASPPNAIDIRIILDDIVAGMSILSVIGTGGMLMLIELIMNLCYEFEQTHGI